MSRRTEKEVSLPSATDAESEEKKRLRSLAITNKLLRRSPANPFASLELSDSVARLQGRDIVKRGQRKSRYLFSFPGLFAPLSAGKVGELTNLATKNPVLYLEFPQGRMKLFGTHVYPKNKYLTLQLTRKAKGVMCEDVFESLIVFSEAWWIGNNEENPEEKRLEFPEDLKEEKKSDYDFKGGAGSTHGQALNGQKSEREYLEQPSPDTEPDWDADDSYQITRKDIVKEIETTPLRQSARTAGKALNYAESSSDEDSIANDTDSCEMDEDKINVEAKTSSDHSAEIELSNTKAHSTNKTKQSLPLEKPSGKASNKKGALVQASLSTLFDKAAEKLLVHIIAELILPLHPLVGEHVDIIFFACVGCCSRFQLRSRHATIALVLRNDRVFHAPRQWHHPPRLRRATSSLVSSAARPIHTRRLIIFIVVRLTSLLDGCAT
ncbi:DNA-binding protein RHL1 [Apostasia shenzhenica]|uniref:DNA-binding protein RHL1 n=1 Tax=Apostasia shenzhenica TaxID=1088818 RepID=A0A2I0B4X8_9ASPA|nr:DNA-binding protein RHL1 [Apostasia shenzhenica]